MPFSTCWDLALEQTIFRWAAGFCFGEHMMVHSKKRKRKEKAFALKKMNVWGMRAVGE